MGHPWQRTKWCKLLVVIYMIIEWLSFKVVWTTMAWFFNVIVKGLYFEQHGNSCMIKEWLPCNDMDIEMASSNDSKMTRIWRCSWKFITKWLMYNDMGNVDHLLTYLLTHTPTHLLLLIFYILPTSYLLSYNLFTIYLVIL
jgi:hypothetical protein